MGQHLSTAPSHMKEGSSISLRLSQRCPASLLQVLVPYRMLCSSSHQPRHKHMPQGDCASVGSNEQQTCHVPCTATAQNSVHTKGDHNVAPAISTHVTELQCLLQSKQTTSCIKQESQTDAADSTSGTRPAPLSCIRTLAGKQHATAYSFFRCRVKASDDHDSKQIQLHTYICRLLTSPSMSILLMHKDASAPGPTHWVHSDAPGVSCLRLIQLQPGWAQPSAAAAIWQ
eukprot:GHRR01012833.1.p1 GENE.GHRR01012833.1~~GHRR01012833.1.p1  ORF type:complete len:229 (+),score=39.22 GHRR01012833.1:495-1181(+)